MNGLKKQVFSLILFAALMLSGGCSGHYLVTCGDQVAPADGDVVIIARVQKSEVWRYYLSAKGATVRFRIEDGPELASHADDLGYAARIMPAPKEPGDYDLHIDYQDPAGDEGHGQAKVYVWKPSREVVAVDIDCLHLRSRSRAAPQRRALKRIAETSNILYFTKKDLKDHPRMHTRLRSVGIPDGPILLWKKKRWHIVIDEVPDNPNLRMNAFERANSEVKRVFKKIPRVVVETRFVNHIPELKREFPKLTVGICESGSVAKTFIRAGLKCVVIGNSGASGDVRRFGTWSQLASKGL